MTYQKKITILSSAAGILIVLLVLSVMFDPERVNRRSAALVWLNARQLVQASSIELTSTDSDEQIILQRSDSVWFALRDNTMYPVKQARVEDLLHLLSTKSHYPIYSNSTKSHIQLGVDSAQASHIIVSDSNATLLDLLVGVNNASGTGSYFRINGEDSVRVGQNALASYAKSNFLSWCDLRLLPDTVNVEQVQRLMLTGQDYIEPFVLVRNEKTWVCDGQTVDTQKVETYIRTVLNAEGENINQMLPSEEYRLSVELDDGTVRVILLGSADEYNRRTATVRGSLYAYPLSAWTTARFLVTEKDFQ
ncbi:MAG: DUF4340 domain-containing protein [Treponema sp.]|jgi:hypothetical protein|nr:DUF4340 domain-containing protein [Treponema sp.]